MSSANDDTRPEFIPFRVARLLPLYDNSGFWGYPSRMGWKIHRSDHRCHSGRCPPGVCVAAGYSHRTPYGLQSPSISLADGREATVSQKVAFLQAWLFFGALAEVYSICGLAFDPNDFISGEAVDTSTLNGLPLKLFAAAQKLQKGGTRELRQQLYAVIRQVQLMMTKASEWEDEHDYTLPQCEVLSSIHILLRVLSLAFLCHYTHPYLDPTDDMKITVADLTVDWRPEGQTRMGDFTFGRLLEGGWCKSEIHLLHGFDVLAFASLLERPYALRNHSHCTETMCLAYQVEDKNYRTLHVSHDCNCASISVDPGQLRDILAMNKVPKVAISDDLKLSVVDGDEYIYVAISHVWADGLGNPFENALPTCQIGRLLDLITNLCHTFELRGTRDCRIALWIDTLCIPVAPHLKQYRKLAIRFLGRTYEEAAAVLVLDRELCRFASRKASILEFGIRIMASGWMKRLWTLQEASLASTASDASGRGGLYIQMGDGQVHWNRLLRSFHYKPFRPPVREPKPSALAISIDDVKADLLFGMHILTSMRSRLPSVHEIRRPGLETHFQSVASAVQNRSTSKAEDEPICLASLLGLDVSAVLSVETAKERMAHFYRLLHEIPVAVMFAHFGVQNPASRNLQLVPFRWAPRSLLSLEDIMSVNTAHSAKMFADPPWELHGLCEEDGLHIRHIGFVFSDSEPVTFSKTCILQDTDSGKRYSMSLYGEVPPGLDTSRRFAVVSETDICSNVVIVHIEEHRARSEDGTEYYVTIIGHGVVKPQEAQHSTNADLHIDEVTVLRGAATRRDQRWCFT